MDWFEQLPESCPPVDAKEPNGEIFYRLVKGNPADSKDFFSQRKEKPNAAFRVDECIARSLSVFKNLEDAERISKMPKFRGNFFIAEVALLKPDGVIMKTFRDSHHSWWRSNNFNSKKAKVLQL